MDFDEIMGNIGKVAGIFEKWSSVGVNATGAIDKGVDVVGKVQENAHKKQLNELTIREKVQELEDNKNDKDSNRIRIDTIFQCMLDEHKTYVDELKSQGLFIEKKREVNEDWNNLTSFVNSLIERYK